MSQPSAESVGPFRGQWLFLSNFFPVEIESGGVTYPSLEHAFQAAKMVSKGDRERVRLAPTPGQARRLARSLRQRRDWDEVQEEVMLELLRRKFMHAELMRELLRTDDRPLVEMNDWGDTFWGVCDGVGLNRLGRLLEQVRHEMRTHGDPLSPPSDV